MPISGVVSFWMGPLKGAVIHEFWGKVYYANPVHCVGVCSQYTPLPGPILIKMQIWLWCVMSRVQAKLNNSVHCTYGQLFVLNQLITILAKIRSVGLTCERISTILIQELQESQPFYLMKWVWTKLNNTFHQESGSTHFAWNSNTFYSSHCTVVLNQTWWSLILVFCWDLWSTHFAWNSFTAVYSSLCPLCVHVISCLYSTEQLPGATLASV